MARFTVVLLLAGFTVALKRVNAETEFDNSLDKVAAQVITECSKTYRTTLEQVVTSAKNKDLDSIDACLIECVFKKLNIIDDENKYMKENFVEIAKKYVKSDGDLEKVKNLGNACALLNDKTFDDKCVKSRMILKCYYEQIEKLGL